MSNTIDSYETQLVLSRILSRPSQSSQDTIKELFPDIDQSDQISLLSSIREVIEDTINTKLEIGLPKRIHRLRYCWTVLRTADNTLRQTKAATFPDIIKFEEIKDLFRNVFPFNIIHDCILEQLFIKLGLKSDGAFIKHYSGFLKPAKKSTYLNIQLVDSENNLNLKNLRRIIIWIIRKNRDKYVEFNKENGRVIHFAYLTDETQKFLRKVCKESDLLLFKNLTEEIEDQINDWLQYNCLDGDDLPVAIADQVEIAKAFIKENNLKNKIVIRVVSQDPVESKRILELESEISRYADEIRTLEESNKELINKVESLSLQKGPKSKVEDTATFQENQDRDLLEYLKIIDSKYSFDVLRSIQLGDEQTVSIKNFLSHFFYGLRKKGLVTYPSSEEFKLSYEQSGLYECIGFEVQPNCQEMVKIEKPGWALKKKDKIYPIKKAIVKLDH